MKRSPPHGLAALPSKQRVNGRTISGRVREVLASRALTLADVSRESRSRYSRDPRYWIPHNLYARIDTAGFSPTMEQVLAFSAITNYRLVHWLAVFGLSPDDLASLAAAFPAGRTVLLDSSVYDDEAEIPWFRVRSAGAPLQPIAPLGHFLEPAVPRQLKTLLPDRPSPFLYVKVGRQDVLAYPDLLPGSIVRVDTRRLPEHVPGTTSFYLVEHTKGIVCSRVHFARRDVVTLRSTELPYAEVALELGREARILGTLDLEFRFVANSPAPEVPRDLALFWKPQPLPLPAATLRFGDFAAWGRGRVALSLREASSRSRIIADRRRDERFFCARATLAGYERTDIPPRYIHRVLTLGALYSLPFSELLAAAGWSTENLGREPIPRAIFGQLPYSARERGEREHDDSADRGVLSELLKHFEEVPFFLRTTLAALTGVPGLSVRDLLWLGGTHASSLHPYLAGGVLAAVDERERKPPPMGKLLLRDQPIYVVLRRDGSYLCARCTLEDRALIIHPFADGFERPVRWRDGVDAEIVGKVVALVRRL